MKSKRFNVTIRKIAGTGHHYARIHDNATNYTRDCIPAVGTREAAEEHARTMLAAPKHGVHSPWQELLIACGIKECTRKKRTVNHAFHDVDQAARRLIGATPSMRERMDADIRQHQAQAL